MIAKNLKPVYRMQSMFKQITDTIASVLKMVLLTKYPLSCPLKPISKELVLLGNGPSLKLFLQEKGDFMKGKDLMMVNYAAVEKYLDFGGIRLEDDLLITEDGCRRKDFYSFGGEDRVGHVPFRALLGKKNQSLATSLEGKFSHKADFFQSSTSRGLRFFLPFLFRPPMGHAPAS